MIPAALIELAPVLDPAQRWCHGTGRAVYVVTIGRMCQGRFVQHPKMAEAGSGFRLCDSCVEVLQRQLLGTYYSALILAEVSANGLTHPAA